MDERDLDALVTDLRCAGMHSDIIWLLELCTRAADAIAALRARAEQAEAALRKLRTEYFIAGREMTNTEACTLIDATIGRTRAQVAK